MKILFLAIATWYGSAHHGKPMANGKLYDMTDMTVATYLYPLGTELEVRYGEQSVYVLVTDRCDTKTEIDMSRASFEKLMDLKIGRATVEVIFDYDRQSNDWKEKYPICPEDSLYASIELPHESSPCETPAHPVSAELITP